MRGTLAVGKTLFCLVVAAAFIEGIEGRWPLAVAAAIVAFMLAFMVDAYEERRL